MRIAIRSRCLLLPDESKKIPSLKAGCIYIEKGKIVKISTETVPEPAETVIDVGDDVVMPGLCDTHVHMNEPGRTDWEGIETATRAAAAGGITTLVDMPLNSIPPTTTVEALELKRASARNTAYVDYGFWGGVIPGNLKDIEPLIKAGVLGFKAFMIDSGVTEFPMASSEIIRESLPILASHKVPLLVHAELESPVDIKDQSAKSYNHFLESRPQRWEVDAIREIMSLSKEMKAPVHIVHLSASEALPEIEKAKEEGVQITVETCPHYLTLKSEDIEDGATHFKCAPPIRENENREGLWNGLQQGIIDFIVSDHSPCTPQLKNRETGNFETAWGGIAGLQFSLPVIWTEMQKRGLTVGHLSYWMSDRPAGFLKARGKTGKIEVGADADLVVWDPKAQFTLTEKEIFHRHKVTPYLAKRFQGVVKKTLVRGELVFDSGKFRGPMGREVTQT
ncbi:allantoinase AllB [bacterium]|nr:allantoinase AllB [bacterium]